MIKLFTLLAILGSPVQTVHDKDLEYGLSDTGGELITAGALNATQYTGWFYVGASKQGVLAIDYTNNSATAVTMACQSALDNTPANGAGYDIHSLTAGTSTTYTWSNAVSGDEKWTWTVYNVPLGWLNCAFAGTGAAAADTATVTVLGVSP